MKKTKNSYDAGGGVGHVSSVRCLLQFQHFVNRLDYHHLKPCMIKSDT